MAAASILHTALAPPKCAAKNAAKPKQSLENVIIDAAVMLSTDRSNSTSSTHLGALGDGTLGGICGGGGNAGGDGEAGGTGGADGGAGGADGALGDDTGHHVRASETAGWPLAGASWSRSPWSSW
eukprot:6003742-Prymnesium_polylepis.1